MACENAAPRDYRACRTGGQGPHGHPRHVVGVGDAVGLPMLDQLQWAGARVPVSVARMPFLIVGSGPRAGERIELVGELVVGRENADVTVSDEEVSRRHLAVRPHEDGVELEDLGSTNGTFVDGARLSAVVGGWASARVILGGSELEIEVEEPEPEFAPSATRLRERPPERDATIVAPV